MSTQQQDKYILRLPDGMRDEIKAAALANERSMNAEIIARLSGTQATLRDQFAMATLTGLCANPSVVDGADAYAQADFAAKVAFIGADAMLAARAKAGEP